MSFGWNVEYLMLLLNNCNQNWVLFWKSEWINKSYVLSLPINFRSLNEHNFSYTIELVEEFVSTFDISNFYFWLLYCQKSTVYVRMHLSRFASCIGRPGMFIDSKNSKKCPLTSSGIFHQKGDKCGFNHLGKRQLIITYHNQKYISPWRFA